MQQLDAFHEEIVKARKAKGLDKWKKLQSIAGKLEGKSAGDITYTCSHPSHAGQEVRHVLGSSMGNLHFLLGYGNPGFHLAPYHWLVMDPNLTDDDVSDKKHPSNMKYWRAVGFDTIEEGDLAEGTPHPGATKALEQDRKQKTIEQEAVTADNGYRAYMGIPSIGLVFGLDNDHVYKWDLVKNSYFAAANPDFVEAMNEADLDEEQVADLDPVVKHVPVSYADTYDSDVYPLVKSMFPNPGTVVPMEGMNAVLTENSVEFYTDEGAPAEVLIYDRVYKSIDLRIDGDVHPEIVVNFATQVLNIVPEYGTDSTVVKGHPTPGYEDFSPDAPESEVTRNVVRENGLVKALP